MTSVVLAAGEGVRMRPLTYTRPKPMLPIANKPILEHLLVELRKAGIREFIFVVGYRAETVRDYFGNGERWGVTIDYLTQRRQLGTAHALKMIQGFVTGKFLVVNGDILIREKDVERVLANDDITISIIEVQDLDNVGAVEVEGPRVARIYEKVAAPPSNLANAGVYLFTADIFDAISKTKKSSRGEFELTDSLQILIDEGHHISYQKIDYWLDVSYPWELLTANEALVSGAESENLGLVEANVVIKGVVSIGRGTLVRSNSYIIGPVLIGENCEIGPNCYIRSNTTIGDNCHIGNAVEVKNSIIMSNTKIPHHNYVGDSVIGEDCNFGAGTKIANLRFDKRDVPIANTDTRRQKLGAIIGDSVQTGINASINVGTLIGDHVQIGPGAVAAGVILPNSRIF